MASFICKVLTPQGQVVKFKMSEMDKITVLKKLKSSGMTPISVEQTIEIGNKFKKKTSANIYSKRKKKSKFNINSEISLFADNVKIEEIIKFTEDFCILKKSKFTNKHALLTIVNTTENPKLKEILHKMINNLSLGIHMYKTMEEYPSIFPFVYVNIIKTGELNGFLEDSLDHAIIYLKGEENIKNNIQKNIIPHLTTFFGIIILIFISVLVGLPLIEDLFTSNGNSISIPIGIKIISSILGFVIKYWYLLLLAVLLIAIWSIYYINTEKGKKKFDHFKYSNRILGKLTYLLDFSRIIRCLMINIKNKMRIQDSLEVSKNVVKNTEMIEIIEQSINDIYIGKSWIDSFENNKMLNPVIIEILKKGAKNNLEDTLEKVSTYLDYEIDKESKRVLKILPEISYAIVGVLLVLFLLIILIPCMQIYLSGFLFI